MAGIFQNGVWSCGFDWTSNPGNIFTSFASGSISPAFARINGQGLQLTNGSNPQLAFGTTLSSIIVGFAFYTNQLPSTGIELICSLADTIGNGGQVGLLLNASGQFQFSRGAWLGSSNGTQIGSLSSVTISPSTWYYLEQKVTINGSSGSVELRVNGSASPIISNSGLNTQNTANAWVDSIRIGVPSFYSGVTSNFDDWIMLDTTGTAPLNTYLGDVRVRGRFPVADSATNGLNQFSTNPSQGTGLHYQNVNTFSNPGTAYNFDANPNDRESYRVAGLPGISAIYFTNTWVNVEKDDSNSRSVAITSRSNGRDSIGVTINTPSSYTFFNKVDTVDPNTGAQWTPSGFGQSVASNAEFGLKVISCLTWRTVTPPLSCWTGFFRLKAKAGFGRDKPLAAILAGFQASCACQEVDIARFYI